MVKVGVIGASGFTGEKLVELLLAHPKVDITYISAKVEKAAKFWHIFPRFKGKIELVCKNLDLQEAVKKADVFFLAVPHTVSLKIAPFLLKKNKIVIDLSADYRIKDVAVYNKYYKTPHKDAENLKKAVYGLPEFYAAGVKKARLIANPGCYPTVSILACAPLLREKLIRDIIIDAKSGITGAGRKASLAYHYAHLSGNVFAYKVFDHQHLPEIEQILSGIAGKKSEVRFTPHVMALERGILVTVYARLTKGLTAGKIASVYKKYYKDAPFVRIFKDRLPQLKDVIETNFCDIGFAVNGKDIIIIAAIDNLIKGASGQAIQNMNIALGFKQELGLK